MQTTETTKQMSLTLETPSNTGKIEGDPTMSDIADTSQVTQPQPKPQPTIDVRIQQYLKLRTLIEEQDRAHKEKMKTYRDTLEQLNSLLLNHLNTIGGDSVKTEFGTVYKTTKRSASLEDPDQFMRHVIGSEAWELLDRKANVTAVEEYVKENGVLPPGVKMSSTQVVGVRKA
jgi:hypothetical protein